MSVEWGRCRNDTHLHLLGRQIRINRGKWQTRMLLKIESSHSKFILYSRVQISTGLVDRQLIRYLRLWILPCGQERVHFIYRFESKGVTKTRDRTEENQQARASLLRSRESGLAWCSGGNHRKTCCCLRSQRHSCLAAQLRARLLWIRKETVVALRELNSLSPRFWYL